MFELTVLGFNVVVPSIVSLLGVALAARQGDRSTADKSGIAGPSKSTEFFLGIVTAATTALAIWSALALRTEWSVWHEDAWMRLPIGTALVALAAGVTSGLKHSWLTWLIRAAAVLIAAMAVFPAGEAWEFLLPAKTWWLAAMTLSTLIAWFLLDRRSPPEAAVLGLSWIVLLIAAATLTGQSFLKVTEPLMAVASVLGCLSLVSLRRGSRRFLAVAAGPCLFAMSAAVASAQFNSFLGLPDGLSWLAMASPALAAALTQWTATGRTSGRSLGKPAWVTPTVCLVLAVVVVAWTLGALPSGGEEW